MSMERKDREMRMLNRTGNEKKLIWYGGMLILGIIALVMIFLSHGAAFKNLVFSNFTDFCMDFFNHLKYVSERRPYSIGRSACFPPFAYVIYYFLFHCIPFEAGGNAIFWDGIREASIGSGDAGIYFALLIYVMAITTLLTLVIMENKKGSKGEKVLFLFLLVFSSPYLFMWERGNLVILSNIFLLIFLWGKNSDKAWMRECSYVALAASAGLKLYPAVAGILLLREKQWKEAARTVLYGVIFFVLPFSLFGGIEGFLQWKDNISIINAVSAAESQAVSLVNFVNILQVGYEMELSVVKKLIPFVALLLGAVSLWGLDKEWKKAAVLCILMIACPGWSGQYTVILMTGPLMLFLDEKTEKSRWMEMVHSVLFVGIFACIVGGETKFLTLSCLIEAVAIYFMFVFLLLEGGYGLWRKFTRNKKAVTLK